MKLIIVLCCILLVFPINASIVLSENTAHNGFILFAPMNSGTTYLITNDGDVKHTWKSDYLPGEAVYWFDNGTIMRTIKVKLAGNGLGGGVQKVTWDGTILWDYRCYGDTYNTHHDIEIMPNGNVLINRWELKTYNECINAGRDPIQTPLQGVLYESIIEVQPTGTNTGNIVWEWHAWNHLIQDYNASKTNYGVVSDHPELMDINYAATPYDSDWMHANSLDYNPTFDQIMISFFGLDEIWIIDHSTTTQEAASHSGGRSGHGGDILYRWGNPATYRQGTRANQQFFNQHDAQWIADNCPGAGHILVFNNGDGRPSGRYSSVDEIIPPVNSNGAYYLTPNSSYGPASTCWTYVAIPPGGFYSNFLSGCERLRNGNTLICSGTQGWFFEVTSTGSKIWEYTNIYPIGMANNVFKIDYIYPEEPMPNTQPFTPFEMRPQNNSKEVFTNTELNWICGDPDVGDTVIYDVYFGTTQQPPKVSTGQKEPNFKPTLAINTTYYWKIVARDNYNATATSPVFVFTTGVEENNPPYTPSNPFPANHSTGTDIDIDLKWRGGDPDKNDEVTYDVYFGKDNKTMMVSSQKETSFDVGVLELNTEYYWKVIARDNHGIETSGKIWTFQTGDTLNHPPDTPIISGEIKGKSNKTYAYSIQSTDYDNDNISFLIDWGDNTSSITNIYITSININVSHAWNHTGNYVIQVKAIDEHYAESDWAILPISMPYSHPLFHQIIQWFFQRFPHPFPLFELLRGY